jgi:hypothetical protein
MTKEYNSKDLLGAIDKMYGSDYAGKSGCLQAVLQSILITVEVREPDLFNKIMDTEMAVQAGLKAAHEDVGIKGEQNDD